MRFDWKSIVRTVAPTIATALGSPLAGMATKVLTEAVLGKPNGTKDEMIEAIASGDPAVFERMKQAEQEFAVEMKKLDVDLEKLAKEDRASAREREKVVGGRANPTLAAVIIVGFLVMVAGILIWGLDLKPTSAALVGTLIGYVSAKADQVVSYYFGSSAGSAQKNTMLEKFIKERG